LDTQCLISVCVFVFLQLPEVEIKDDTSSELKFELCHKFPETPEYPILLEAHKSKAKTEWLNEIRQYAADICKLLEKGSNMKNSYQSINIKFFAVKQSFFTSFVGITAFLSTSFFSN
jgi:hypothetical protein